MSSIVLLIVLATIAWGWRASLISREAALSVATNACQKAGWQFLDGSVALSGIRLQRRHDGWLGLIKTYQFDYSIDGVNRQRAWVSLFGTYVLLTGFDEPEDE